jgi:nucleoside-diphosphate-sugar epimerase
MKIFVAGATGAIGRRLVPLLVLNGHDVVGMTRSADKAASLRADGATPAIADALDPRAVLAAVRHAEPDVVVHELTSIPPMRNPRKFDRQFELTNRLRREGTDYLLAAARAVGARRFVAQSFAGWPYARDGGPVKVEENPLDTHPPAMLRRTLAAIRYLESAVVGAANIEGLALRYGILYGPGTSIVEGGAVIADIRRRRIPIVGEGTGVWSFLHVDDAAGATLAAIERGQPGVYNVVDDEPAPVSVWLPALASAIGAKPPRHVPIWMARLAIGEGGVSMMTEIRGASNAKAKREFGWHLRYPSWRQGFEALFDTTRAEPYRHAG